MAKADRRKPQYEVSLGSSVGRLGATLMRSCSHSTTRTATIITPSSGHFTFLPQAQAGAGAGRGDAERVWAGGRPAERRGSTLAAASCPTVAPTEAHPHQMMWPGGPR